MNSFQTRIDGPNAAVRGACTRENCSRCQRQRLRWHSWKRFGRPWKKISAIAIRRARSQFRLSDSEYFAAIGRLRKLFYTQRKFHERLAEVMASARFDPAENAFDPIRLRAIAHDGHLNPAAQALYYGHRDTWYSNPQSMISWWIPLHDVRPEETFEFFPDHFDRVVPNDSECFDFDTWVAKGQARRIGWRDSQTGRMARYPQLLTEPTGHTIPVACHAGEILLFSGQHLHKTRPNRTGRTRFSIDFRTVHLEDHACGRGAPNVDNRSTGSSLPQMIRGVNVFPGRETSKS